jgi:tripartite-type tricarboxylate transporter receptor subunit TctC
MKFGARAVLALAALRAGCAPASAQMQMIIPWPVGGGTDIIGRLNQPAFTEAMGTQVVMRNVGSATG